MQDRKVPWFQITSWNIDMGSQILSSLYHWRQQYSNICGLVVKSSWLHIKTVKWFFLKKSGKLKDMKW